MESIPLSEEEMRAHVPGEALTLAAVLAVLAIALLAIVAYKIWSSEGGGSAKLPGGWQFTWK
ncbi:MAG: hypothetical protein LKK13_02770 [Bacilli bacterium]|jgi:hypothetical protein|nr:hypothetical protein [Bacilli bacterium]